MGCQMNKSDTERMLGMLSHFGYEETKEPKEADLLMINTCSIRQLSEDKAYSAIGVWGKWKKNKPDLKIGFCGCVAQQKGEDLFKRAHYIDFVLGTHHIYKLPEIIKRVEAGEKVCECEETHCVEDTKDYPIQRVKSVNAWIPITEGCNNFCTYCIVPYTRGRERSRLPEVILKEAKDALTQGYKEITLLGQNVDSYGKDFEDKHYRLAQLLEDLNAIEEAQAYQNMMKKLKLTQEELAKRIGKSRAHVANTVRLLKMPQKLQDYVLEGTLTMGHIKPLITIDEKKALEVAKKAIEQQLSVREVEDIVKGIKLQEARKSKPKEVKPQEYVYVEGLLRKKYRTKIKVDDHTITLKYTDTKDLNRILELMGVIEES